MAVKGIMGERCIGNRFPFNVNFACLKLTHKLRWGNHADWAYTHLPYINTNLPGVERLVGVIALHIFFI